MPEGTPGEIVLRFLGKSMRSLSFCTGARMVSRPQRHLPSFRWSIHAFEELLKKWTLQTSQILHENKNLSSRIRNAPARGSSAFRNAQSGATIEIERLTSFKVCTSGLTWPNPSGTYPDFFPKQKMELGLQCGFILRKPKLHQISPVLNEHAKKAKT